MINTKELISLAQDLIRINSENPPGNEKKCAHLVSEYLMHLGLKVKLYEFKRARTNVVAEYKSPGSKKILLVTAHLDTVPAGSSWKFNPFAAEIHKNRIYGRGAADCKGNLAVLLAVMDSIVRNKINLGYNLLFLASSDEETGSRLGIEPLLNKRIIRPDAAVILDSDDFDIITAQKGLIHFKVKVSGKKAHGAYPYMGKNAIELASRMILDIKKIKFKCKTHKLLKAPTVNIGTIQGGDKVNIVADWCEFCVDLRFLPGMKAGNILRQIKKIISRYTNDFKIEINDMQIPFEIEKKHFLVKHLIKALKDYKIVSKIKGSEGATVITFFQDSKIPAIATGFSNPNTMHISDEYIDIKNLVKGATVLESYLKRLSFE